MVGVAIAILAFCILRTLVAAWYLGVEFASDNRLITRNKTSLIYSLPLAHGNRILQVPGVTHIAYGTWFGGVYKDKRNFFPQFAVSGTDYLALYPEFLLTQEELRAFETERRAAIAGIKLAERHGWEIGDIIPLEGTIYPTNLEFVLRGIYRGARTGVDETAFFFHWDYLNERVKEVFPERAGTVGWYIVGIDNPARAAPISEQIDALFANSLAETMTETEKAFQLGFVAMTGAIVGAIRVISIMVIFIILLVLANTMAMTARERTPEYAAIRTLGFGSGTLFLLISAESVGIALLGGLAGAALSLPGAKVFQKQLETFLPVFQVSAHTLALAVGIALLVGLLAALIPALRVSRMSIVEGLSHRG
jgi:putative ABC transport system permease protein